MTVSRTEQLNVQYSRIYKYIQQKMLLSCFAVQYSVSTHAPRGEKQNLKRNLAEPNVEYEYTMYVRQQAVRPSHFCKANERVLRNSLGCRV
jgi:hypothetical protein